MLAQYSHIIFIFLFILYCRTVKNMVYHIWTKFIKRSIKFHTQFIHIQFHIFYTILRYKINRKIKTLQEYWASMVTFIGIFSRCNKKFILDFIYLNRFVPKVPSLPYSIYSFDSFTIPSYIVISLSCQL